MNEILVWLDAPADGPSNMAADELLAAESARQDRPLIRFYAWTQLTFSLGGFQPLTQARAEPSIASLPFVRRPSGGGGIIHGSDLTYAVAVPRSHPWGARPQTLYEAFHESLARVLAARAVPARLHEGRGPEANDERRLFCFDRRARGDLVVPGLIVDGHKILGSAQRRLSAAVLQHGSLLLSTSHWDQHAEGYLGLADVFPTTSAWGQEVLVADWLTQLTKFTGLGCALAGTSFVTQHTAEVAAAAGRFRDPAWLGRR